MIPNKSNSDLLTKQKQTITGKISPNNKKAGLTNLKYMKKKPFMF